MLRASDGGPVRVEHAGLRGSSAGTNPSLVVLLQSVPCQTQARESKCHLSQLMNAHAEKAERVGVPSPTSCKGTDAEAGAVRERDPSRELPGSVAPLQGARVGSTKFQATEQGAQFTLPHPLRTAPL